MTCNAILYHWLTGMDKWFGRYQKDCQKGKHISSTYAGGLTAAPAIFPCDISPIDEHC